MKEIDCFTLALSYKGKEIASAGFNSRGLLVNKNTAVLLRAYEEIIRQIESEDFDIQKEIL